MTYTYPQIALYYFTFFIVLFSFALSHADPDVVVRRAYK